MCAATAWADPAQDAVRLHVLTQALLDPARAANSLADDVVELTGILHRHAMSQEPGAVGLDQGDTLTTDGLALSPALAAQCAADATRTVTFIRGLYAAIVEAQAASARRPVRVLYVGSGPYALLATPLMTVFPPGQVQFTVLDIHEPSVRSARSVVRGLGLADSVAAFKLADALVYRISPEPSPEVIVLEIMTAALESEPQVAITRHLVEQAPEALLVPQSIAIDAYMVDVAKEFAAGGQGDKAASERVSLGRVFELSRNSVASWAGAGKDRLPAAAIEYTKNPGTGYVPMLFTTIQVYGLHVLSAYESGLTMPRILTSGGLPPGERAQLYYQLGHRPGLRLEIR